LKDNPDTRDIPVLIVSNLSETDNVDRYVKMGAVHFFVKSNQSLDEILKKVAEIV